MDIATFQEKLRDYAEQYKTWSKPILQVRQNWQHRLITAIADLDKYYQEIEEVTNAQEAKYKLPKLINSFLDENYEIYLNSTPEECQRTRALLDDNDVFKEFLLYNYVRRTVSQLQITGEEAWLLRCLVAMSLEDNSNDYRDTLTALAELFVTAEMRGLAPYSSFQRVSHLSNHQKSSGGQTSLSEILINFQNYSILQERRNRETSYWEQERHR